jgi:hypothetical protein
MRQVENRKWHSQHVQKETLASAHIQQKSVSAKRVKGGSCIAQNRSSILNQVHVTSRSVILQHFKQTHVKRPLPLSALAVQRITYFVPIVTELLFESGKNTEVSAGENQVETEMILGEHSVRSHTRKKKKKSPVKSRHLVNNRKRQQQRGGSA